MPRKPPPPVAPPERYIPISNKDRIRRFRVRAAFAAEKFAENPEAGRREAAIAALGLVLDLTNDPAVMAPFTNLLEMCVPRRGNSAPHARWKATARIAAATDGLMHLEVAQAQAAGEVLMIVDRSGFELKRARGDNVTPGTIENLRTKFLNGLRNPDGRDAPENVSLGLFERIRHKYYTMEGSVGSRKQFIADDLYENLLRLKDEVTDEEGRTSDI